MAGVGLEAESANVRADGYFSVQVGILSEVWVLVRRATSSGSMFCAELDMCWRLALTWGD